MQRYFVVTNLNGAAAKAPFKEWFRSTQGVEGASSMTTHQMRNHMKRLGWRVQDNVTEVLIIDPQSSADQPPTDFGEQSVDDAQAAESSLFALESHLRDYLAKNLNSVIRFPKKLSVVGVEYSTAVGPIDLLAKDESERHYVFELKLDRGPDKALGQLLRYMGWCSEMLPGRPEVHGVILAAEISDKLRFAAKMVPNVALLEYELQIKVRPVALGQA